MKTLSLGRLFVALSVVSCSHSLQTRPTDESPKTSPAFVENGATDDLELYQSFDPVVQAQSPPGLPVPRLDEATDEPKSKIGSNDSSVNVAQTSFKKAMDDKSFGAAMRAVHEWIMSCGPPAADECRNGAYAAMEKAGALSGKASKGHFKRLSLWREAFRCVKSAERTHENRGAPSCWSQARHTFQKEKDAMMLARMLLMDGRWAAQHASRHKEAQRAWLNAEKACLVPQCRTFREEALYLYASLLIQNQEWKKAAQATFQLLKTAMSDVIPPRQKLVWPEKVENLCARIDAGAGSGTCRRFETQYFSTPTFYDFSKEVRTGELPTKDISKVNAHFLPLMQACLREQALRLSSRMQEKYSLRWVIGPDGRVLTFELLSPKGSARELEACLLSQFSWWRYPRYEGENRGVEQTFTVRASTGSKNP